MPEPTALSLQTLSRLLALHGLTSRALSLEQHLNSPIHLDFDSHRAASRCG